MVRVLFVDDEPKVLHGLQRMLSDVASDWETAFAESGREALERLAAQPFDVVVSDMRMPNMDGASLLTEVMRLYPHIVRIVLSGHSERELVLRSVGATHQFLAKPCNHDQLRSVVMRAVALRRILASLSLRSLVSQLNQIPSEPQLYRNIMLKIGAPDTSLSDLGNIISQDVGMTAKILQIVNSAFFGLPRHVTNPVHAVCLLGVDVIKSLVLAAHIFGELTLNGGDDMGIDRLWKHSTATGAIARSIASAEDCEQQVCDHALMAGLLHDAGRLILAANLPSRYREMLKLSQRGAVTLVEAERQVFGATHAEVGAYLFGLWGLPDPTVEAVAFHHCPAACAATTFTPLTAVHAANALEHAQSETEARPGPERLDMEYLARLGLVERLPVWQDRYMAGAKT